MATITISEALSLVDESKEILWRALRLIIGAKISLKNSAGNRFEGEVYMVCTTTKTLWLQNVMCFGQEDSSVTIIPTQDNMQPFMAFQTVSGLKVLQPTEQMTMMYANRTSSTPRPIEITIPESEGSPPSAQVSLSIPSPFPQPAASSTPFDLSPVHAASSFYECYNFSNSLEIIKLPNNRLYPPPGNEPHQIPYTVSHQSSYYQSYQGWGTMDYYGGQQQANIPQPAWGPLDYVSTHYGNQNVEQFTHQDAAVNTPAEWACSCQAPRNFAEYEQFCASSQQREGTELNENSSDVQMCSSTAGANQQYTAPEEPIRNMVAQYSDFYRFYNYSTQGAVPEPDIRVITPTNNVLTTEEIGDVRQEDNDNSPRYNNVQMFNAYNYMQQ